MKVIEYSKAMGLDMIQGDHEDAPGQLELNFNYDDVVRNADRLSTYRQICAQVAREFNLIACFLVVSWSAYFFINLPTQLFVISPTQIPIMFASLIIFKS